MRNRIALWVLFVSWPVEIVHRILNNAPERIVSLIVLDKTVAQDFRWYMVQSEMLLSMSLTLAGILIAKKITRNIRTALWSLFLVSIVDIVNYWLWFRRNEILLTVEGIIMLLSAIIILKNASKPNNETTI